jgi:phosphoribosyl 1,2-cyclic phosphate phosphodiesterase
LKVTFLGTGTSQGVPVIGCECKVCTSTDPRDKRLRSSIHIDIDDNSLVIDTGPDFRQQMLREKIKKLDAVIFTHGHKDHTAGLDDVRAFNHLQKKAMPVYGAADVLDQLKLEYAYAFADKKYPGLPQLDLHELTGQPFEIESVHITPLPVLHLHLPVLGFRIYDFAYITDANAIPEETLHKLNGVTILVLNALQREKHPSHFNLEEAIAMAKKIGAQKTYFTHISHKLDLHQVMENELPDTISLAFDGLRISVDR